MAQRLATGAEAACADLGRQLGISVEALAALGVGWDRWEQFWSFPERNAQGEIIGISARYADGQKKRLQGSKAGLSYADSWDTGEEPILLVEGGSDTAALLGIGLNVVGRPSNTGGVELLIELLSEIPETRPIIVIGERDQKDDGRWPGRDGATRTAQRLADALVRPVGWALPPDDAKDSRAWLCQAPLLPSPRLALLFLDGLNTTVIEPPPRFRCAISDAPIVPINEWREWMLKVRLESIGRSGFYVDASTTGAGKSTIDYQVILQALREDPA